MGKHFKEASNFLWPFKLSNAGECCLRVVCACVCVTGGGGVGHTDVCEQ